MRKTLFCITPENSRPGYGDRCFPAFYISPQRAGPGKGGALGYTAPGSGKKSAAMLRPCPAATGPSVTYFMHHFAPLGAGSDVFDAKKRLAIKIEWL